jgi:hypothetical protein
MDKGRGKTVHSVALEKQNVEENHKILKKVGKPSNRRSSRDRGYISKGLRTQGYFK